MPATVRLKQYKIRLLFYKRIVFLSQNPAPGLDSQNQDFGNNTQI